MMKGNIWVVPNNKDFGRSMRLILEFQLQPSIGGGIFEPGGSSEHLPSEFRGLQVIFADYDDINRAVT
uniref:Uncharacterized protein n=1 Tax=Nelumbo nucifera TaxID=4432 RepID=A0A822XUZ0_NELNU|nr:TPA_asm: hypothetical protein HUJ06_024088 [Nelumbo nucifera]